MPERLGARTCCLFDIDLFYRSVPPMLISVVLMQFCEGNASSVRPPFFPFVESVPRHQVLKIPLQQLNFSRSFLIMGPRAPWLPPVTIPALFFSSYALRHSYVRLELRVALA